MKGDKNKFGFVDHLKNVYCINFWSQYVNRYSSLIWKIDKKWASMLETDTAIREVEKNFKWNLASIMLSRQVSY